MRDDRLLPRLAMNADWSSRAACPSRPSGGEHLVPVVADPTARPAIPAAARQTHRVGMRRAEERLRGGRPPVDQQPPTRGVGEPEPPDVHGLRVVDTHDAPEAQVEAEATQGAKASREAVDLHVPVQGLLASPTGRPACRVEAVGQVGDGLFEARSDGSEMLLVVPDQLRGRLGAR